MPLSRNSLMFFSTARLDTPIFADIASAVIEGSEITKSIIFCPVRLTLLDTSSFAPNFFHRNIIGYTEPFLRNFSVYTELFSIYTELFLRIFSVYRVLFEGTVYPVGHLFYGDSTILAPIQIIESGEERGGFGFIARLLARHEVGELLGQFAHLAQTGTTLLHVVELGKHVGNDGVAAFSCCCLGVMPQFQLQTCIKKFIFRPVRMGKNGLGRRNS